AVTFTVKMPGATSAICDPDGGAPRSGATRSRALTSQTRTRRPRRADAIAQAAEMVDLPAPPFPVMSTTRLSKRARGAMPLDKLTARAQEVHRRSRYMLGEMKNNPLVKRALAAGEERMSKIASQLLSNPRFVTGIQTIVSSALTAKGVLDKQLKRILEA